MVHQNMVPFRPDVHCSHIGKTGGGKCDDVKTFLQTVGEDYFARSPLVPYGFRGSGGLVVADTPGGGEVGGGAPESAPVGVE